MPLKYSLMVLLLLLLCGGRLIYEQFLGNQDCEMTWMYQYPQYLVSALTLCEVKDHFMRL